MPEIAKPPAAEPETQKTGRFFILNNEMVHESDLQAEEQAPKTVSVDKTKTAGAN
jgi:hypothetical protein